MNNGLLIEVCGLDGSGKTTQARRIVELLKSKKLPAHYIHPFKNKEWVSKELKEIALIYDKTFNEMYSNNVKIDVYSLDLLYNSLVTIKPLLDHNNIVIVDKYKMDSEVYIPLFTEEDNLFSYSKNLMPDPDIIFFLEIDPLITKKRVDLRDPQKNNLRESYDYMERANQTFLEVSSRYNMIHIDGTKAIEEITSEIMNYIEEFIKLEKKYE